MGGGTVCYTKGVGRQEEAAKEGARVLDIPGDLAASGQADSNPASGESQLDRGKEGAERVPPSPTGGQMEAISSGGKVY